jgi:hypothetical protein
VITEVTNELFPVGKSKEKDGELAFGVGPVDIGEQRCAVPHFGRDVYFFDDSIFGSIQRASFLGAREFGLCGPLCWFDGALHV